MDVSVIIINYNTFDLTAKCVRSVIEFTKSATYEIIVVDNASTERDPAILANEFPGITLITSPFNGGFAYGNNLGIERATGQYILLLNSDTVLMEDSIGKSIAYIRAIKNAGVLGCRMIYPDGQVQHTARRFRSIGWELLDLFRFIPFLMSYKKRSELMLGKYFRCDRNVECDWVNGAFFMAPARIIQQLPGKKLDDRFFMYGEDQLWCEQIRRLGYKVLFYAGTTIVHIGGASTDATKQIALRRTMMKRELSIMRSRRGPGLYYWFFTIVYGFKEGMRNLFKRVVFRLKKGG